MYCVCGLPTVCINLSSPISSAIKSLQLQERYRETAASQPVLDPAASMILLITDGELMNSARRCTWYAISPVR